jgi:myo-inositol 2-dehydrogenase / D-chiro-inositol 1-dehydrogenase
MNIPPPASLSRRIFIRNAAIGAAGLALAPHWLRAAAANSRINIAQIGCGRMGSGDMVATMAHDLCRIVAVCDLDSRRAEAAKQTIVEHYQKKGESTVEVKVYHDYREVLARPDIDAVIVSVPDHWHAQVAIEAALAGKHLYVQKPVTYCIAEAIALRSAVRAKKVILQTGSQQRSSKPYGAFRTASEAVRNGRLGQVKTVKIGIGLDKPKGQAPKPDPIPGTFDYERWLGPAPEQPYMEARGHPQQGYGRPGWITTEDFGLGMITNWGAHHVDIMLWALGLELSGPNSIEARAEFMKDDVWTVHSTYHVEMGMPNGTRVIMDNGFENGLLFEGDEGTIFCARSAEKVTASDPNVVENPQKGPLRSSKPSLLEPLPSNAVRWMPSSNHYLNWLEAITAGRDPIAPIDQSARALEACSAAWIGMKLGRNLTWDPKAERFVNDDAANAMLQRKARKPEYDVALIMKKAGLT